MTARTATVAHVDAHKIKLFDTHGALLGAIVLNLPADADLMEVIVRWRGRAFIYAPEYLEQHFGWTKHLGQDDNPYIEAFVYEAADSEKPLTAKQMTRIAKMTPVYEGPKVMILAAAARRYAKRGGRPRKKAKG